MMPPRVYSEPSLQQIATRRVRRLVLDETTYIQGIRVTRTRQLAYVLHWFRNGVEMTEKISKPCKFNYAAAQIIQAQVIARVCELAKGEVQVFQISFFDQFEIEAA